MEEILTMEGGADEKLKVESTSKSTASILNLPPEIQFKIFELVEDPFDAICFGLVSQKLYTLTSPFTLSLPLSSGSPSSATPHPHATGCRHCVPVLYSPAHCELHFHIRSFFPSRFTYCSNCDRFSEYEKKEFSDSREHCGGCGIGYRRRFVRGRRLLDLGEEREVKRGSR
ncbi:hypothetical protein ACEPPN_008696 [Leptodophora sp. 'Broadleaf-Isolate-01']